MATDIWGTIIEKAMLVEEAVDGIEQVLLYTPEVINLMPCIVNYPLRGVDVREEATTIHSDYTFGAELYVCRGILTQAEMQARPLATRVADALWNEPTLYGAVDTILAIRHAYTPIKFAGQWHMGIRFEVDIKVRRAVAM